MSDEQKQEEVRPAEVNEKNNRPLGLSLLLIFSFVYNGLLAIVMIVGLFNPDIVQSILQQYYKQVYISGTTTILLTLSGALVFGISFFGLILLWKYKRKGFYYYATAQVIMLLTLVIILKSYDYTNIAIVIVILVIFGLYAKNMK